MITQRIEELINAIVTDIIRDDVNDSKMETVEKMFRNASVFIANVRHKTRQRKFQMLKTGGNYNGR